MSDREGEKYVLVDKGSLSLRDNLSSQPVVVKKFAKQLGPRLTSTHEVKTANELVFTIVSDDLFLLFPKTATK